MNSFEDVKIANDDILHANVLDKLSVNETCAVAFEGQVIDL